MNKFEYITKTFETSRGDISIGSLIEKESNTLGATGWELVSSFIQPSLGRSEYALVGIKKDCILVFKREIGG
jgi:hypothetical protein